MKAIVLPRGKAVPELRDWPPPDPAGASEVMLRTVEVGICGTDALLLEGVEGAPPPGADGLVLGHEGLFEVVSAGEDHRLVTGDLVVTSVRWPDPRPCPSCAAGRPDLCVNGQWTEHGIRGRHGFMREFWSTDASRLEIVPRHLRGVAVLLEPLSVVVKGLETVAAVESVRAGRGDRAVVLGAGPVGILAACCLRLEGRSVLVMDRVGHDSLKHRTLTELGAEYARVGDLGRSGRLGSLVADADVVVEAAGAPQTLKTVLSSVKANGVVLVLGTGEHAWPTSVDLNAAARVLVQENKTIFGSVNASPVHLRRAVGLLGDLTARWPHALHGMIRRFPPADFMRALDPAPDSHVKAVISFE
ncbi:alcohol dehydrogenase catalytic domain-containing protein [Streptosporangium sp. NPDC051022]|uniref:alcohol dehydrogenase catalytic domain-containing protein n=1 Tax=Streptosporangium sp. NPDC051022 TaxID=3155752 RepID=UPI00341F1B7B